MPPYLLAKLYAWRGMLLSPQFLQELAGSKDLSELANALKATHYSAEIAQIQQPYTALKLEHALRRRIIWMHYRIMTLVPRDKVIQALYLRYIARNVKTVLRGLHTGQPAEDIGALVDPYAEELTGVRDLLARLLASDSLKEALNTLGSYYPDLRGFTLYAATGELSALDGDVDRWFYGRLSDALQKTPKSYCKEAQYLLKPLFYEFVLETILRGKIWGLEARMIRSFVENLVEPELDPVISVILECQTPTELRSALSVVRREMVPTISEPTSMEEAIMVLKKGYRLMLRRRARGSFLKTVRDEVLGVALLLLFEDELVTLVGLASGIEQGLSSRALLDLLPL
jgi:vacuolar-type H+-ATPase subunit C/Vma6